jgi:hypothetical protein
MVDVNIIGTFVVNAHVADAINKPLNHPDGTDKHAPFWTSDEERGVIVNFASAAAQNYARCLAYGPTKTATIGITRCRSLCFGMIHQLTRQHSPTSWGHQVSGVPPSLLVSPSSLSFRNTADIQQLSSLQ